ncbi:MAG TPA: hypothetical protein VKT32_04815 [Chthonomonadaceae bacterium]|nr:hypothetical protein [Chthonomonadaceae bacterium]
MAQRAERKTCPRCGANNFETVSACWKCGAPLGPEGAGPPAAYLPERAAGFAPVRSPVTTAPPVMPPTGPSGYGAPAGGAEYARAVSPSAAVTGDAGAARRAAIALALTFPWIGLPAGWIFMMIEDSRKQAIGRICAVWSLFALIFHLLLMFALTEMAMSYVQELLPLLQSMRNSSGAASGIGGTSPMPTAP